MPVSFFSFTPQNECIITQIVGTLGSISNPDISCTVCFKKLITKQLFETV